MIDKALGKGGVCVSVCVSVCVCARARMTVSMWIVGRGPVLRGGCIPSVYMLEK